MEPQSVTTSGCSTQARLAPPLRGFLDDEEVSFNFAIQHDVAGNVAVLALSVSKIGDEGLPLDVLQPTDRTSARLTTKRHTVAPKPARYVTRRPERSSEPEGVRRLSSPSMLAPLRPQDRCRTLPLRQLFAARMPDISATTKAHVPNTVRTRGSLAAIHDRPTHPGGPGS